MFLAQLFRSCMNRGLTMFRNSIVRFLSFRLLSQSVHSWRASARRRPMRGHGVLLRFDPLEDRVMPSSSIVTNGSTSGVTTTQAWMAPLPGSLPLTDISLPGTSNSAAGPSMVSAILGDGGTGATADDLEDTYYAAAGLTLAAS